MTGVFRFRQLPRCLQILFGILVRGRIVDDEEVQIVGSKCGILVELPEQCDLPMGPRAESVTHSHRCSSSIWVSVKKRSHLNRVNSDDLVEADFTRRSSSS